MLSSTLLAAQRSSSRVPYVKIVASNKLTGVVRLDWQRLYEGSEPDHYHALSIAGDGSLIRVRIGPGDDSSKLYRQRVVNPGPASDFSSWTYTGEYGCQAVTVASRGAEVHIFWVNASRELKHLLSMDYGATWGSPEVLDYAAYAFVYGISAAHKPNGDIAVFFTDEYDLYVKKRVGGNWQEKSRWNQTTGEVTSVAGFYDADWNLLVTGHDSSGNYKVWSLVYGDGNELPSGNWSDLQELASAPAGGDYEYRAVYLDKPDVYRAFYVEKFSGTESYNRPQWTHNIPDTEFISSLWREPIPFNLSSEYGVAIAHHGDYCWLSTPNGVWRASLAEQELELTGDVLSASMECSPEAGGLTAQLRNEDGRYDTPGTGSLAVLDTGCQLDFSPGYVTSGGNEACAGLAYWLSAYEHVSAGGKASLVLYAIDGWRLLADWRARHQFRWNKSTQEKSVKQIMEFILARAGLKLEVKSESAIVTGFYPDFTIHPGDAGSAILTRLLSFIPDFIFIEGTTAYLVNSQPADNSIYSYGGAHSIITGSYRSGVLEAGHIRVEGIDPGTGTLIAADTFAWEDVGKFPERIRQVADRNIGTVAQALDRGASILRKTDIKAVSGNITTPVNCGQQMWDVIDITDKRAGLSAAKRRVNGIDISYRPERAVYVQKIYLGGV